MSITPQLPIRPKSVKSAKPTPAPTDIAPPVTRPLKAYAFDPSAGKLLGNEMSMPVRYQKLEPGPVVRDYARDAIAVIDYDGANKRYYTPVNLDDPKILIRGRLDPDASKPRL